MQGLTQMVQWPMNIKAAVFDFGRVLIFPKDNGYFGSLNDLHKVLSASPNYNFFDHFELNQELLNFIKEKKTEKNLAVYLFTKGVLKDAPECQRFIGGVFKEVYVAENIRLNKSDPRAYKYLSDSIAESPGEILYVDDHRDDTQAAEQAGLITITFRNNMQFETEFEGYV